MVRFEVFQQSNRPNHFTVVEVWKNQKAPTTITSLGPQQEVPRPLTPMTGALYDERLYRAL